MTLVATDDPDEQPIAPLPPHERQWRHPSELARAQRIASSIPPPPLSRVVGGIALALAAVMAIVLVVLVAPRTGGREELPVAVAAPDTLPPLRQHRALGIASLDRSGQAYLFHLAVLPSELFGSALQPPVAETLFVTTFGPLDAVRPLLLPTEAGSLIPLEVAGHDERSGLSLLRSMLPVPVSGVVDVARRTTTAAGAPMVLHGHTEHPVKIGLRVASDSSDVFLPFDVDGVTKRFVAAAPVTDADGRFAGLFVHRNGAVGVVPLSAIVAFVEEALQPPG